MSENAGNFLKCFACLAIMAVLAAGAFSCSQANDATFAELTQTYDVIIMKHCYPSSNIVADTGNADPSSPVQSLENYKAVYRLLRDTFDANPDTLFICWTLPPLHRLANVSSGDRDASAALATGFSEWLITDFLTEGGPHPNVRVWDFRGLVMDPVDNYLKYDYERNHESSDSHPNDAANNYAGPLFSQFIADSVSGYFGEAKIKESVKIIFLHHSTGGNVYEYPDKGVAAWLKDYNRSKGTNLSISETWYPADNNMPVHYYRAWLAD